MARWEERSKARQQEQREKAQERRRRLSDHLQKGKPVQKPLWDPIPVWPRYTGRLSQQPPGLQQAHYWMVRVNTADVTFTPATPGDTCKTCGGSGALYSHSGLTDWDTDWDISQCEACGGTGNSPFGWPLGTIFTFADGSVYKVVGSHDTKVSISPCNDLARMGDRFQFWLKDALNTLVRDGGITIENTLTCMWCGAAFCDIVILEEHEDACS